MGLLTFCINVTPDGCVDHLKGIADDETHAFVTRLHRRRAGQGTAPCSSSGPAGCLVAPGCAQRFEEMNA